MRTGEIGSKPEEGSVKEWGSRRGKGVCSGGSEGLEAQADGGA